MDNLKFKLMIVYGKIEGTCDVNIIKNIYYKIDEVAKRSNMCGEKCCIIGDFNAKIGKEISKNNEKVNNSGKMLLEVVKNNKLLIINAKEKCKGLWTRENSKNNLEKAVLDYVICNEEMEKDIVKMVIDDEQKYIMERYMTNGECVKSDHNTIILEIKSDKNSKKEKGVHNKVIWNTNNPLAWDRFRSEIAKSRIYSDIKNEKQDLQEGYKKWMKTFNRLLYKCFDKARINNKNKFCSKETKAMMKEKREIKRELTRAIKTKNTEKEISIKSSIKLINNNIAKSINDSKKERVNKLIEKLGHNESFNKDEMWKLKKELFKQSGEKPMAIYDAEGTLCDDQQSIIGEYRNHYMRTLQQREPKEGYEIFESIMNQKFKKYKQIAIQTKMKAITFDEVKKVIKKLQVKKACGTDTVGNIFYKQGGDELAQSMVKMFNKIIDEQEIPNEWYEVNITSFYKGKGNQKELKNQRGIFLTQSIRKIFERIICNRIYKAIDQNMSEYQNGARKGRNIVDHLFVIRNVLSYYKDKGQQVIIEFLDLEKCFDKLCLNDTMNALYKSVNDQTWNIIYELNKKAKATITTPLGNTDEINIAGILMQGTVLAAILCANNLDEVSQVANLIRCGINMYGIQIKCLTFQDDIISPNSSIRNAKNFASIGEQFQDIKKLKYNIGKSAIIKTKGKAEIKCKKEKIVINEEELEERDYYRYLGDELNKNMNYEEIIKVRTIKGQNTIKEICAIISHDVFSKNRVSVGIQLIECVLIPRMFFNSEAWINIRENEIHKLNMIILQAIKRVLKLPSSTSSIGILAETGIDSAKIIIERKKLSYLQRLLKMKKNRLPKILYEKQKELKIKNSWWEEICNIKEKYSININDDDIENMTKYKWKIIIKDKITNKKGEILMMEKGSKTMRLKEWKKQEYLVKLEYNTSLTAIRYRLGMMDIKTMYKNKIGDIKCIKCKKENETLEHLIKCIKKEDVDIYKMLFSEETQHVMEATEIIKNVLKERDSIRNSLAELPIDPADVPTEDGDPADVPTEDGDPADVATDDGDPAEIAAYGVKK